MLGGRGGVFCEASSAREAFCIPRKAGVKNNPSPIISGRKRDRPINEALGHWAVGRRRRGSGVPFKKYFINRRAELGEKRFLRVGLALSPEWPLVG